MPVWITVIGILLFALVTIILYIYGLKKSVDQKQKLSEILYNRCANKVMAVVKHHGYIDLYTTQAIIKDVKASEFYSRQKAVIHDSLQYSKILLERMCEQKLIRKTDNAKNKYEAYKPE